MEKQFDITTQNRKVLRSIYKSIPKETLFRIPDGFRNSIWWNTAHTMATQQILLYRFSQLPPRINDDWINRYMKGTIPSGNPLQEDVEVLESRLIDTANWAREDFHSGIFKNYEPYTTSTKITINSIEDAIQFNNYHEGLHLGVILSQLKALGISLG